MCDQLWVVSVYLVWNQILVIHLIVPNFLAPVTDFTQQEHAAETPSGARMMSSLNKCTKLLFFIVFCIIQPYFQMIENVHTVHN